MDYQLLFLFVYEVHTVRRSTVFTFGKSSFKLAALVFYTLRNIILILNQSSFCKSEYKIKCIYNYFHCYFMLNRKCNYKINNVFIFTKTCFKLAEKMKLFFVGLFVFKYRKNSRICFFCIVPILFSCCNQIFVHFFHSLIYFDHC